MASDDVQTNIRIPSDLKDQLQASAEKSSRSLSSEIAFRVQQGFDLELFVSELQSELDLAMREVGRTEARAKEVEQEAKRLLVELNVMNERSKVGQKIHDQERIGVNAHYEQQIRELQTKLSSLESAKKYDAALLMVMAQFVISAVDIAGPVPGVSQSVLAAMKEAALALKAGDREAADDPMTRVTVMLMALQKVPDGRDPSEFVTTALRYYEEERSKRSTGQKSTSSKTKSSNNVIIERQKPVAPKLTNRGPTRNPNALTPKSKP